MPVLSPSRYSGASGTSLSTSSYRSTLSSSSSLERPYYSTATGSYIAPRTTTRSNYSTRTSNSYGTGEFRSHRFSSTYDSDGVRERKTSVTTSEYSSSRRGRAPSISDSDSGISGVYRSERSSSRSRDTSVSRSESSRSNNRSDSNAKPYMSATTADLYEKYSVSNYVPLSQRLLSAQSGDTARSRIAANSDSYRPPVRRVRPQQDSEVKLPRTHPSAPLTNSEKRHATNNASTVAKPCAVVPPECATNTAAPQRVPDLTDAVNNSKRDVECTQRQKGAAPLTSAERIRMTSTLIPRARVQASWDRDKKQMTNGYRDAAAPISDDNGNDLQLSVSDIRRKFDTKMTVTKLPAKDPDLLYKTAHSSDNIYGALRNLNNGSVSSLADDKPVPVHKPISSDKYVNGATGSLKWEFPSSSKDAKGETSGFTIKHATEPGSDVSTIYIAGKMKADPNPLNSVKSQLNANNSVSKILEKSTTIFVGNGDAKNSNGEVKKDKSDKNVLSIEIGKENSPVKEKLTNGDIRNSESLSEIKPKHTSDFASYIQVSTPVSSSNKDIRNGDASDESSGPEESESPSAPAKYDEPVKSSVHLLSPDEGLPKLRYIDSEPSLEADEKLLIDYNGKDDDSYEEQGFENKTFEHANGHLLRKGADETDFRSAPKLNGIAKIVDGLSSDEEKDDCNSNDRYSSCSPTPDGSLTKRKYRDLNGEASSSSSLHQIYQNDSLAAVKNSSPVNTLSSSSGLNSNSTCGSLTTSRRRSIDSKSPHSTSEGLSKTSGLNGLRNIGNTCFMNSVVQCLSNTKPLMEYCGNPDQFTSHINTTLSCMKGALIKAFSTVIMELWKADETDGVVNTTALKTQIQRFAPRFMGYSQQDAQEFLRYLLEGLHEDVNRVTIKPKPILTEIDDNLSDAQKAEESWQRYLRAEDSKVSDIFVGQLKSSLRCTHCSHTSVTFDLFWDLSLPIPSRTGQHKLTQCLSHFTKEEELDGDEKPTCSKCQVRRKCLKWFTVQKFPRVLVLHLKRFSPTERFRGKLNVPVEFPLTGLDMTPYAATTTRGPPPPPAIYNLYAVSNHSGTTYSGHYTAYCKHPYNGEWHEYNDSRVSPISPKNVVSSEAYVLFYELASGSSTS